MAVNNNKKEDVYVKLISSDGHVFYITKEHALTSKTINAMLNGPGKTIEGEMGEVNFSGIESHVLEAVCKYFMYKTLYKGSLGDVPEFPIAPELALETLLASNFLDC